MGTCSEARRLFRVVEIFGEDDHAEVIGASGKTFRMAASKRRQTRMVLTENLRSPLLSDRFRGPVGNGRGNQHQLHTAPGRGRILLAGRQQAERGEEAVRFLQQGALS